MEQKDSQGNPIDSPEYDPRTLYIPASAWKKFTPFEKQYWEIKHKFWDTVRILHLDLRKKKIDLYGSLDCVF